MTCTCYSMCGSRLLLEEEHYLAYKDASDHDWALQYKQWCPCPRWMAAGFGLVRTSTQ